MEAIIHQALGHVFHLDAGAFAWTKIENAFVRDQAVPTLEEDRKMRVETFGYVVGVEDRDLRCFRQAIGSHHPDVHPRDRQYADAAVRGGGDRAAGIES